MRSHIKHGYSHDAIVDYALVNCNNPIGRKTRRRPIFTHLGTVRTHLTYAQKYCAGGTMPGFYSYEDHVRIARDHLRKAREWRQEIVAR